LTDAQAYINRLNTLGMRTSVVTDNNYANQGEDATEVGWNVITAGTGGKTYDINTASDDFSSLMVTIDQDMTKAINSIMSNTPATSNIVSDIKTRLNAMVNSLARQINYLQKSGITLDGNPGSDMFEPMDDKYPMQLGNIKLSDTILSDKGLNTLAAGKNYAKGDNTIALEIANLRGKDLLEDSTGEVSFDEYYRSIILDVGNQGSEAQRISLNQTNLVQSADNARTSISGVSMDEEMSTMMKYKFAYDAASRALNTIDQMISTVIERMGVTGR
jgi:flagellar hook-associated protein 1 FlgK